MEPPPPARLPNDHAVPAVFPPEWLEPGAAPLEVDFGCHRGTFLLGMAEKFPVSNFLGIERQPARVTRCLAKIARLGIPNAHAVAGEGAGILREILPDACVAFLHVSFPDPWPKRRHASRRLVDEAFLSEARRVLRPGGSLRLMTDDEPYFTSMCRLTSTGWREIPWDDDREPVATAFEKRFLSLGLAPFRRALRQET